MASLILLSPHMAELSDPGIFIVVKTLAVEFFKNNYYKIFQI